ncbi:hypothetical protein BDV06DRAFT_233925 [Aspergillus oleicola]
MSSFPLVSELTWGGPIIYGLTGYMLWRLWRFTVCPLLNPTSPKELPYIIPCEPCNLIAKKPPRSTLFCNDATEVLRDRPDLVHTEHIKDLLHGLGCSGAGISEIDNDYRTNITVSKGKVALTNHPSLYKVATELMKKQLLDRDLGNKLLARTLEVLETQLSPSLIDDHIRVDHDLWRLLFRIPTPFAREVYAARARVHRCLVAFLRLPDSEKRDQSWAIEAATAEMRSRGMSEEDMASYLLMVFWATNANTFKIVFWLTAYTVSNPATLSAIITETTSILAEHPQASLPALSIHLERNPLLEALHNEVHRISLSTSSARTTQQDITINNHAFKARTHVVMSYRHLAMSHPLLAQDWDVFQPQRFLSTPDLAQSKAFLPFGGGKHKCVGRFLSRRLVVTFVALVVRRFVVREVDAVPGMDFRPVSSGPGGPVSDMRLVLRKREVV